MHCALFSETKPEPFAALLDADDMSSDELRALRRMISDELRERSS